MKAAVETPTEQLEYIAERFMKALEETGKIKKPTENDGGVKASLKHIPTTEQINKNIELVAAMQPVSILSGNEFQKSDEDLITQIEKYFVSLGGKVSNAYGDIELRRKGIKSSVGHGMGRNKAIAFKAVPDVLKKGKIVDYQKNWKGRGYDTVVFAAPITIADQEYYMASVVVVEATKNDYYLHEVLLQKKEDEALFKTGTLEKGTSGKATSPIFSLLEKLNDVKQNNGFKYSYAGVKAKTADIRTLDYAERLEDVGKATPEEIRRQTGWFRGYDGKWRFELDDSKAIFRKEGDIRLRQNEKYRRLEELTEKLDKTNYLKSDETQELKLLEREFEDDVWDEKYELQDYLDYPALYEAYPSLRHLTVSFEQLEPGVYGLFRRNQNMIVLRQGTDEKLIKSALIHELQHAIQKIEDFAGGSSPAYWNGVPAERKPGTYEYALNRRNEIGKRILESASPEFVQAFREYNRGEIGYRDLEKIGTEDELDLLWDYDEADKEAIYLKNHGRSDEDLYWLTAGEIEARDTERRLLLNAELRKNIRPDIGRTDVVFAEGEILSLDIKTDADGNKFVDVNPELFDARDGESHAKTIARIIKERFDNLISVNGQQIQINKTTNREWLRSESATYLAEKQPTLYLDKLKTIPYANEIIKAANNWIGEKPNHIRKDDIVEFARGEVLYRVGNNGYIADVLVGIRSNGAAVLYSLKNIYEKEITDISLAMASKSPQRSEDISVKRTISHKKENVKTKFSRQRLSDAWEDIRTKMYENEVHEDIINEVEEHIRKLRRANITREEEVTHGLIPKYEALLKLAREHTKGSEVKATQLADTLNDLMWAAHDGNLDTKQFISTVKLIAEDIIRTGSQVNDDMYREYEEFRRMTREETVYVSQQVYNQYVEEYSTVKNLNRACAGKIKIKPYTDGNKTGRALDDFYAELVERFPKLLHADTDIYHQLFAILDAWRMLQPRTEFTTIMLGIRTRADLEQAALIKAEEILSEVLGITDSVKTIADKYADKLKYQQEHYKEYYRKQAEEGRRRRRENENIAVLNKRILRNTNRLSDMLRNETDTRHIPENLKTPVAKLLTVIAPLTEKRSGKSEEIFHFPIKK